jgi:adenylate cyclase, class 2
MAAGSPNETEIKIRLTTVEDGLERLRGLGFELLRRREYEDNVVLDTEDAALRRDGKLLRVRRARGKNIITYKGRGAAGRHKTREEIETEVGDFDALLNIFERLGYTISFRYQKFRSEYWRSGEPGVVTIDETPIGVFLELEGPGEWIDRTAALLGFHESDYITASYGSLFLEFRKLTGDTRRDMVFDQPPDGVRE